MAKEWRSTWGDSFWPSAWRSISRLSRLCTLRAEIRLPGLLRNSAFWLASRLNCGRIAQPALHCFDRLAADRQVACFVALAGHHQLLLGQIDIVEIDANEFGQA